MPTDAMLLEQLRYVPASQIESAIGLLGARPRNAGVFATGLVQLSRHPEAPTTVGYATTARVGTSRSTKPVESVDWYQFVADLAGPKVLCLVPAELETNEGVLFGQASARILARFGVQGAIVDGCVRDTAVLNQLGFSVLARGAMLRHGVPCVAGYGMPVEIGEVRVETGQVVAFDADGAIAFPVELLRRIPEGLARFQARTQPLLDYLDQTSPASPAGVVSAQKEGGQY
ncbi:MAG: hypothetical protein K2X03_29930 [Bryobacteraceae bacterium]|nr:hypothetical protein [Bryobacteraceae bacterium]